jgi:Sec-independent protein translocase protein TatA
MDIIGIGGPEFIILLVLGAVILGPRRVVGMASDIKQSVQQIQNLTRNISKEINREFDLLESKERQDNRPVAPMDDPLAPQSVNGKHPVQLPEAYKKFREDFPNDGEITNKPKDVPSN